MSKIVIIVVVYTILFSICGCNSINLGGSGQIGTVTGGGSVSIPIPK